MSKNYPTITSWRANFWKKDIDTNDYKIKVSKNKNLYMINKYKSEPYNIRSIIFFVNSDYIVTFNIYKCADKKCPFNKAEMCDYVFSEMVLPLYNDCVSKNSMLEFEHKGGETFLYNYNIKYHVNHINDYSNELFQMFKRDNNKLNDFLIKLSQKIRMNKIEKLL